LSHLFRHIAFYVGRTLLTDTSSSIATFKNELFNDLVVVEARIFKIIASFTAENMGKKTVISYGKVKNIA